MGSMERKLVPWVVLMMVVAGLYAFDQYYDAGGVTGFAVNSAQGAPCSETDSNNPGVPGVTSYGSGELKDACVGDDLLEFYCSEKGPDVRAISCANGCFAGACN